MFGGTTPGGGNPVGGQLRSALDAGDSDEILGKIYNSKVLRRLTEFMALVRLPLSLGATGVILRTAANLVTPFLVAIATNNIVAHKVDGLTIAVLAYLGVLLVILGAQYLETLQLSIAGQGILFSMRTRMFAHLQSLSLSFFDRNKVGKIMSRVQNDVDQLQTLLTQDVISVTVNAVTVIGIAAIMIAIDWKLALLALIELPILVIVMFIWQKFARRAFILARKTIAVLNDNLQESISGARVTQSLSREAVNIKQFDAVNKANLDANKMAARLQGLIMPVTQILTDGSYVIVLIFGGFQVLSGTMSVGFLLAFLLYIQRFSAPVQQLATMYTEIQRAMASGGRIFELLDVEPEIKDAPDAIELPPVKGEVSFQKVGFAYEPGVDVLYDIDFTIKPGETVGIVGRTGAGKSSIASLIARFYEVNSGRVLIDGHNVTAVSQQSLRRRISIVPQDPFLFSGSIEDNIRDGQPDASHDEIVEAAKACGIHDFITHMKGGYETPVGERGGSLSAGQRQLVCLARAILADPAILILDEATSNVDTNTEHIMQESLRHISRGRTCIIIAHRLSTVTGADYILVLEHGRVVETGHHAVLMAKQGVYYQIFQALNQAS